MTVHTHERPDNEEEHLDSILGRGPGDPDAWGYPGQDEAEDDPNDLKVLVQNQDDISELTSLNSITSTMTSFTGRNSRL